MSKSQLLASQLTDPKLKASANLVFEQSHRLSGIITDLMDFAKPQPPSARASVLQDLIDNAPEGPGRGRRGTSGVRSGAGRDRQRTRRTGARRGAVGCVLARGVIGNAPEGLPAGRAGSDLIGA